MGKKGLQVSQHPFPTLFLLFTLMSLFKANQHSLCPPGLKGAVIAWDTLHFWL